MKERPELFNGAMVRAIIEGRKTMTRRVVKPGTAKLIEECMADPLANLNIGLHKGRIKPPYSVGDRLWVRETWKASLTCPDACRCSQKDNGIIYRADMAQCGFKHKWKPSIFMPRRASRITLEVTHVRAERLQDISEKDAIAEGVERIENLNGMQTFGYRDYSGRTAGFLRARQSFATLWGSIYGEGAWDANPWVWVTKFKVLNK